MEKIIASVSYRKKRNSYLQRKILLIEPPFQKIPYTGMPLGLGFIAGSIVKEYPDAVDVLDCNAAMYSDEKEYPDLETLIARRLSETHPDVIGISANATTYYPTVKLLKLISDFYAGSGKRMPKIVVGGPLTSGFDYIDGKSIPTAKEVLDRLEFIDAVVRGEGEWTARELFRAILNNETLERIAGVSYRQGKEIVHNKNRDVFETLDPIPFPSKQVRRLFKYDKYWRFYGLGDAVFYSLKSISIHTSRGCFGSCTFCYSKKNWGGMRYYSPKKVLEWIKDLSEDGVKGIFFEDDLATLSDKTNNFRFHRILDKIISAKKNDDIARDMVFGCGTRADCLDEEMARMMDEGGLKFIYFGFESASEKIRANIRKLGSLKNEAYEKAVNLSRKHGIHAAFSLIFGLPGESRETLQETVDFVRKFGTEKFEVFISLATLYPGTQLSREFQDGKWGRKYVVEANTRDYARLIKNNTKGNLASLALVHGYQSVCSPLVTRNSELRKSIEEACVVLKEEGIFRGQWLVSPNPEQSSFNQISK